MKKFFAMLLTILMLLSFTAIAESTATVYGLPVSLLDGAMEFYIGEPYADCVADAVANGADESSLAIDNFVTWSRGDLVWADASVDFLDFTSVLPADMDTDDHEAVFQTISENGVVQEIGFYVEGYGFAYDTLTADSAPDDVIAYADALGCPYERTDNTYNYKIAITLDAESELVLTFTFTNETNAMEIFNLSINDEYLAKNA